MKNPQALVEEYGRRIFGLCMRLCRERDAAEELYQETWLRALDRLESFSEGAPFEPWIVRICVNLYRDGLRREKLRRFLPLPAREAPGLWKGAPPLSHEERFELRDAVDSLPEKLRIAVVLYCVEGLSEKEAAAVLGITPGGFKSRIFRARKILKEALTDENGR